MRPESESGASNSEKRSRGRERRHRRRRHVRMDVRRITTAHIPNFPLAMQLRIALTFVLTLIVTAIAAASNTTFQGVRYALFAFNVAGGEDGSADFDSFSIHEPLPRGLKPIPHGKQIFLRPTLEDAMPSILSLPFVVVDRGLGRVSLKRDGEVLTVQEHGRVALATESQSPKQQFQWMETLTGEIILLSLATHRYVRVDKPAEWLVADSPGPTPDGMDGARFALEVDV